MFLITRYKNDSGAKLAQLLGITTHRPEAPFPPDEKLINWGNGALDFGPFSFKNKIFNTGWAVANAINKRDTFYFLSHFKVPCLTWATNPSTPLVWNSDVYVRFFVKSSKGKGIQIYSKEEVAEGKLPPAPLYTKAFPTKWEFRVHVFRDILIDFVQKKKMGKEKREKLGIDEVDTKIRSHNKGWCFVRNNLDCPELHEQIIDIGKRAVKALFLDFGAVDILVSEEGEIVVCEVNTAPGLSPSTLKRYSEVLHAYCV